MVNGGPISNVIPGRERGGRANHLKIPGSRRRLAPE